jgi:sugar phosphate isomerase/epimerase
MGTMHAIADIGYRDLDMYPDVFGLSPRDTREGLARFGLACRSSRFTTAALYGAFEQVLDVAKYLGARWVTLANVPAEERRTWGDWNNLIAAIVRGAEAARKAGLTFCYHHHDFELQSLEGRVPLDVLLASTDPELVRLQMDVYWMTKGGRNPVSEIRRLGGRVASLHLKDMNATPDRGIITPGRGTIDFAAVLRAASAAKVMDVFVEEDNPGAPMEAARFAFQHLSRI